MSKFFATEKLFEYRSDKGYTQLEMAGLLSIEMDTDVSLSAYQKWEQGTTNLTSDNVLMLARFTKIPIQELVTKK